MFCVCPFREPVVNLCSKIPRTLRIKAFGQIGCATLEIGLTRFNHGEQLSRITLPLDWIGSMSQPMRKKTQVVGPAK